MEFLQPAGAGAIVVALAVLWLGSHCVRRRRWRLPPGPWALPVVGNLLHLSGLLPHRTLAKLSERYGPIFYLRLGSMHSVVVSNASLAKEFLSAHDKTFASRPPSEASRRLEFGQNGGIGMAPYGPEWRYARKLCSLQLFTAKRVREFQPLRNQEISLLIQKLKKHQESNPGEPIDLTHAIATLTETITCRVVAGKTLSEVSDATVGVDMKEMVQRMTELFQVPIIGDFVPYLGFLDRKTKRSLDAARRDFDVLLEGLLSERDEDRRRRSEQGSPTLILDVLLGNLDKGKAKTVMTELLVAAIDTSATTLDWAMAELMGSPQAMRKLREELDKAVERERMVEEADLPTLEYMRAVLKETLRMHPPVPLLIPHMSTEACEVAGYTLPKETRLFVNAWAIGRDPKTWEDPERFMPERFLTEKGIRMDVRGQDFELLPFGAGRRSCPGLPLALPLLQSTLSNLVHTFHWESPPGHKVDFSEKFGTVVSRAKPLLVIPSLR